MCDVSSCPYQLRAHIHLLETPHQPNIYHILKLNYPDLKN